ncbi:MAG: hypothetical protein Q7P63_10795 [Verrucomicrobiota bacterium JB022]|nr:hypothetical protein [Verrucomicrobiota bacterium JB022]
MTTKRIFWALLLLGLFGLGFFLMQQGLEAEEMQDWARGAHPAWVIAAILFLPMFGFPISITLFITGLRFGFGWGMLVVAVVVLLQLLAALPLGRGPLRGLAQKCLGQRIDSLSKASLRSQAMVTFFTTLIPGPPYIGKIYGLAAAHIPARLYYGIGWPVFVITSVPLVGLGSATFEVQADRIFLFIALGVALAFGLHWARKRWSNQTMANAS